MWMMWMGKQVELIHDLQHRELPGMGGDCSLSWDTAGLAGKNDSQPFLVSYKKRHLLTHCPICYFQRRFYDLKRGLVQDIMNSVL